MTAPLITLAATVFVSNKEKISYFAKLISLVCFTCFVLNLVMLIKIFNIALSPNVILAWAILAFLLAYATDTRLLLTIGIMSLVLFLYDQIDLWIGRYLGLDPFLPIACVLFMVPYIPHHRFSGFGAIYRMFAMLIFFMPVLILSYLGERSYIDQEPYLIEAFYQVFGFTFSALAIWLGIKKGSAEVVITGNVFLLCFFMSNFLIGGGIGSHDMFSFS